jgi:hypothetical protein
MAVRTMSGMLVMLASIMSGCSGVPRDPACEQADRCDRALEDPYQSFGVDDVQFGDDGSCWLSAETAVPCVEACERFVTERRADVDADGDGTAELPTQQSILDACG